MMDLWSVVRVALLRRWYASLPVLALAGLCAYLLGSGVAPTYTASSKMVLRVPNTATGGDGKPVAVNPYLGFNGSLTTTSNVLARILEGETVRADLAAQDLAFDFEVLAEQQYPMVTVSVESADSSIALLTVQELAKVAEEELGLLQTDAGAPADQRIGFEVVSQYAAPLPPARSRVVVLTLGVGAGLSLVAGLFAESAAVRAAERRRRRLQSQSVGVSDAQGEVPTQTAGPARVRDGVLARRPSAAGGSHAGTHAGAVERQPVSPR